RSAVASRELPALITRLVRERSWGTIVLLFGHAGGPEGAASLELAELELAAHALTFALETVPAPRGGRDSLFDELRVVRIAAAEALLARAPAAALTEAERRARRRAATLMAAAGDHARAAVVHEELGDDARAAEAWGALGDLDRMEAAHARDDARSDVRRAASDVLRRFDVLLAAGERRRAITSVAALPAGAANGEATRQLAARLEARLLRGRGVTLRVRGGATLRVCALPARLGRDPLAEIPLRDPGVSRQHATIVASPDGLAIEDAGSRAGLRVAGARVDGRFPLRGDGEISLGATTPLRFSAHDDGRVVLRGVAGLDRDLVALVGADPLALALVVPRADGVTLELAAGTPRLSRRADVAVRVDGHFVGDGCDLLAGDVVEILGATPVTLEVA
ncbi:MAG TPA: FHA domain-containing protein, partial [Polyangia bacterium]|nr:FHA domain-containing protein [Polyangia bacterium]